MRLRLLHKGFILILLPMVCSLAFIGYISVILEKANERVTEQMRSARIIAAAEAFQGATVDASMAVLGHLSMRDPNASEQHLRAGVRIKETLHDLKVVFADQPDKLKLLADLRQQMFKRFSRQHVGFQFSPEAVFSRMTEKYQKDNKKAAELVTGIFEPDKIDRLIADEKLINESGSDDRSKSIKQIYLIMAAAVIINTLVTLGLALYFNRDILARLQNVRMNIMQIAGKGILTPPSVATDEIAQLDTAVHETARQIKQLEQEKHQLIAVIADRLKSPLDAIRSTIERLRGHQPLDERGLENLQAADTNLDRLIRMVGELLNLDRLEESRLDMSIRPTSITDVLRLSAQAASEAAAQKKIKIECRSDDFVFNADPDRLVQVLVNLLANAIKFSPDNSLIEVTATNNTDSVQLRVRDHGRGMPEEFRSKLFKRFAQAYDADGANKKGFGLGLSICKMIVDQHYGRIDVESQLGEGTTFIVTLPKHAPQTPDAVAQAEAAMSRSNQAKPHFKDWLTVDARLSQKGLLLVGLPLVCQIIFVSVLAVVLWQANAQIDAAFHARTFTTQVQRLRRAEEQLAEAGLYNRVIGGQALMNAFYFTKQNLKDSSRAIVESAPPSEVAVAQKLDASAGRLLTLAERIAIGPPPSSFEEIVDAKTGDAMKSIVLEMGATVEKMEQRELGRGESILPQTTRRLIEGLLFGALALNVFLACGLLIFVNKSVTKRIQKIIENTKLLAQRGTLAEPQPGRDEIASIDRAFYDSGQKLMELERFKDELVSMVGHDIRTPLTTVNAALALSSVGAFGELTPDLQTEVETAENESNELITLINDLLAAEKTKTITVKEAEKAPA